MKTNKQQQKKLSKNKQTISKLEKQQTKERKPKYKNIPNLIKIICFRLLQRP
jgi:hypothetical protein